MTTNNLRKIGNFWFPDDNYLRSGESHKTWKKEFRREMLHNSVMVLAVTRIEGAWKAYCFPVEGRDHDLEMGFWKYSGQQISENVARAIFPYFEGVPYAR